MKYFFSPEGNHALRETLRADALFAFDYDGTLAPITEQYDDTITPLATVHALQQLARSGKVVIVTGRSVRDVATRLGFTPHLIIGNHGAEAPSPEHDETYVALVTGWHDQLITCSGEQLCNAGVIIENKIRSLTLHYRQAQDQARARQLILGACARLSPPARIFGGKCVVNLAVPSAPDKADALLALAQREDATAAIFVGDDENDEVVFERAPAHWLTIRVGRDPGSRARYYLEQQDEILPFIQEILGHLAGR